MFHILESSCHPFSDQQEADASFFFKEINYVIKLFILEEDEYTPNPASISSAELRTVYPLSPYCLLSKQTNKKIASEQEKKT